MHIPSIQALLSFESAARHLSFQQAAAELNVTPGAVSRQIQALESVLVRLTPLKLFGDVAQIEMEISAALPDGDTTRRIERKEQWLASRDTTSSVTLEAGQPPRGYRFLVTARF